MVLELRTAAEPGIAAGRGGTCATSSTRLADHFDATRELDTAVDHLDLAVDLHATVDIDPVIDTHSCADADADAGSVLHAAGSVGARPDLVAAVAGRSGADDAGNTVDVVPEHIDPDAVRADHTGFAADPAAFTAGGASVVTFDGSGQHAIGVAACPDAAATPDASLAGGGSTGEATQRIATARCSHRVVLRHDAAVRLDGLQAGERAGEDGQHEARCREQQRGPDP